MEKELTWRRIAKTLAAYLSDAEGESYTESVNEYLEAIRRLPQDQRLALRSAFIFSRRVPAEEREDCLQEFTLKLLEKHEKDEKLAYAIARCDWRDWWREYSRKRSVEVQQLGATIIDDQGNEYTAGDVLEAEIDYEAVAIGNVEARRIWGLLPWWVREIVARRLAGENVSGGGKRQVAQWATVHLPLLKVDYYKA